MHYKNLNPIRSNWQNQFVQLFIITIRRQGNLPKPPRYNNVKCNGRMWCKENSCVGGNSGYTMFLFFGPLFTKYYKIWNMNDFRQRYVQLTTKKQAVRRSILTISPKDCLCILFVVIAKHMRIGNCRHLKPGKANKSSPGPEMIYHSASVHLYGDLQNKTFIMFFRTYLVPLTS